MPQQLTSFLGLFVMMLLAWLLSNHKRSINWRLLLWGLALQAGLALFIFRVPAGARLFLQVNEVVVRVMDSSAEGARFVFGRLALPPGTTNANGESSLGFILAFQAFPTVIFFSALTAILYFVRLVPFLIKWFAWGFTRLLRVSGAESLCAVSSVFFGIEAVFTIKPHLKAMTRSELAVVLTLGMSTVASNVLALYVFSLREQFPHIAGHLVSASLLSAPAALIMAKLMFPETETPETLGLQVVPHYEKEENVFMAVIHGANAGLKFIAGIVALLIAVLSLVYLFDGVLGWLGHLLGLETRLSLKMLLGGLFYPLTYMLGIPPDEVGAAAQLIGEKLVLTEVVAYTDLAHAVQQGSIQSPRTIIITSYALCGFTHLASMAIFVGGIATLVPNRVKQLTQISFKCLLAATLACLMTACMAGLFATDGMLLGI